MKILFEKSGKVKDIPPTYQDGCDTCLLCSQFLRSIKQKGARQVNMLWEYVAREKTGPLQQMKQKIGSKFGHHINSQRLCIVEPVFGRAAYLLAGGIGWLALEKQHYSDNEGD